MSARPRPDADRGTLSIFVAICATALLMLAGLVLDGGGRLRAIEHADALAQEAARAGGQQIDQAQLLQNRGLVLDQQQAVTAADDYLKGMGVTPTVTTTATTVKVTITTTYHTSLLGLIGLDNLTVHGVGQARLVPGVNAPDPLPTAP